MATRRGKRGNGEGSIYQDADGRWRSVVDLGYREGRRSRGLALLAARQVRDLNAPKPSLRHAHGTEAAIDRTPSL